MNERIKQLYEQAHEQMPIIVVDPETCEPTHKVGHNGKPMYYRGLNSEKFAELIVRECGQYLNSPEFIGRSDLDWAMVLDEHFGVE